jgi:hypothetical protein
MFFWVKTHEGGRGDLGIFTTCIKNIHLQNVLHLILGFLFGLFAFYFIFTNLMLFNIILK